MNNDDEDLSDALDPPSSAAPSSCAHNSESVPFINDYARQRHNGVVQCEVHSDKGRVLLIQRSLISGQTILAEPPLIIVQAQESHPLYTALDRMYNEDKLSLEAMWYWCALCSIRIHEDDEDPTATDSSLPEIANLDEAEASLAHNLFMGLRVIPRSQQEKILHLYCPEVEEPRPELFEVLNELCLTGLVDPLLFERLLQVWVHNCFEHSYEPLGYVMYYMPSFASHSCMPNAVWACDKDDVFVLTARLDIAPDDELVISYVAEEVLNSPAAKRQRLLNTTKGFTCACTRCSAPADTSRGFRCPQCLEGEIYLTGHAGSSNKSGSPSSSSGFIPKCREARSDTSSSRSTTCDTIGTPTGHKDKPPVLFGDYLPTDVTVNICGDVCNITGRRFATSAERLAEILESYTADVCTQCQHTLRDDERTALVTKERALYKAMKKRNIFQSKGDKTTSDTTAAADHRPADAPTAAAGTATGTGAECGGVQLVKSTTTKNEETIGTHVRCTDNNNCTDDLPTGVTGTTRVAGTNKSNNRRRASRTDAAAIINIDEASMSAVCSSSLSAWGDLSSLSDTTFDKLVDSVVTTHYLKACWHGHLALTFAPQNRWMDAMRELRLKLLTTQRIYPGLTADKAWILEEIGDSACELIKQLNDAGTPHCPPPNTTGTAPGTDTGTAPGTAPGTDTRTASEVRIGRDEDKSLIRLRMDTVFVAVAAYQQGLEILRIMFGEQQEYTMDITSKLSGVMAMTSVADVLLHLPSDGRLPTVESMPILIGLDAWEAACAAA